MKRPETKPTRSGSDRARDAILARRAKFVAAALASIACGKTSGEPAPHACLKVAPVAVDAGAPASAEDSGAQAPPLPCLEIALPPAAEDAAAPTDAGKRPTKPKHNPRPCLLMAPAIDDSDHEKK